MVFGINHVMFVYQKWLNFINLDVIHLLMLCFHISFMSSDFNLVISVALKSVLLCFTGQMITRVFWMAVGPCSSNFTE